MTKGYILAEVSVRDPDAYRASGYMQQAEAAVAAFGGRFLVRGDNPVTLEGEGTGARIVILEFPSRAVAERFYNSELYAPAIILRQSLSTATLTLLDEYDPAPEARA